MLYTTTQLFSSRCPLFVCLFALFFCFCFLRQGLSLNLGVKISELFCKIAALVIFLSPSLPPAQTLQVCTCIVTVRTQILVLVTVQTLLTTEPSLLPLGSSFEDDSQFRDLGSLLFLCCQAMHRGADQSICQPLVSDM